jgi:hypothetical protein
MTLYARHFTSTTPVVVLKAAGTVDVHKRANLSRSPKATNGPKAFARKVIEFPDRVNSGGRRRSALRVGDPTSAEIRLSTGIDGFLLVRPDALQAFATLIDVSGKHMRAATNTSLAARVRQHAGYATSHVRSIIICNSTSLFATEKHSNALAPIDTGLLTTSL